MSAVPAGKGAPDHARRVIGAWLVLSVVATPLVAIFVGPLFPPGRASEQASGQVTDNTVMLTVLTPIICLLLVFFVYALSQFRHDGGAIVDGPPLRTDNRIQVLWVAVSAVVVLFFAGFGTYELLQNGAGGGQGPGPVAVPSGNKLQVQVIGQQWMFTYRYPSYGGLETPELVIPANTLIELHVTSLDMIHSFWAYELGVKADANPGVDNVAFLKTKGPQSFHIHCAELCGLWHGYMTETGHVVPPAQFAAWIKQQQQNFAPVAKYLPPYSNTYSPDPQRRAG
ncbi:MAG TPA: cytochrome c oxidase subunit II [Gaiellaceae bacterium]|jgi:cytochrome c oxidase subunit 2|nr:cytochrome c oxidase subunit II [Gaiellaceae bacterium]